MIHVDLVKILGPAAEVRFNSLYIGEDRHKWEQDVAFIILKTGKHIYLDWYWNAKQYGVLVGDGTYPHYDYELIEGYRCKSVAAVVIQTKRMVEKYG